MKKKRSQKIFDFCTDLILAAAVFFCGYRYGDYKCYEELVPSIKQANDSLRSAEQNHNSLIAAIDFMDTHKQSIDHYEVFDGKVVFFMKDGARYEYVGNDYMDCGSWTDRSTMPKTDIIDSKFSISA